MHFLRVYFLSSKLNGVTKNYQKEALHKFLQLKNLEGGQFEIHTGLVIFQIKGGGQVIGNTL